MDLTSTANATDLITFDLSQNTWPASVSPFTLTLAAQQHAVVSVRVSVPVTAALGISDTVRVTAQGTSTAATSDLTTSVSGWRVLLPVIYAP